MDAIREITRKFDEMELHYRVTQGKNSDVIRLSTGTDSGAKIDFTIFPSGEKSDVSMRVYGVVKVPENKSENLMRVCNELNKKYRYVKFFVDSDRDVNVAYDITRNNGELGETVLEIMARFHNIINEAYPVLMRAIWA